MSRTFNGYGEVSDQGYSVNIQDLTWWNLIRDDNSRIIQKTEAVDGTTSNHVYTYDSMGRLMTVTRDGTLVEEYDYDANGTRIYEMNALRGISGRSFTYSDEDHLLTAGDATYQYDPDGYLTAKTVGTEITSYSYSSRGELLNVTLPDGKVIEYVHDPLGRRIAKKVDGAIVEKYLWQGLTRLLAVYDGSDNLIMRFEYAYDRMPVAMTSGGSTYYLTYDQVGSLRVVADASGNVIKRIDYDSFGNIINDTDPSFEVPFGFAGGMHERDTGLVRFGYRDYDPDTGRWTAKDPILFAGGNTDLCGYVLNDPINAVDPLGLTNWGQVIGGGVKIVGGGFAIAGGVALSETGVGLLCIPIGESAIAWGLADVIAGFNDKEIPYSGTIDLAIKESTNPGLTQDGLSGINNLTGMFIGGRGASVPYDSINSIFQNANSIYNSGSTIIDAMNGNDADSPCSKY